MRAARIVEPGKVECVDAPMPEPSDGEILVRTLCASVCGSDVKIVYNGYAVNSYPCRCGFPGHESVGLVEESRHEGFRPGDLALLVPSPMVSGAYADHQVVAGASAIPLGPEDDPARLVLAQQLGTVIFALRRFWTAQEPGRAATVIGAGSAGLMFAWLLVRAGFEHIVVSDLEPARLAHARALGADVVVDASEGSVAEATLEVTGGVGADLVVEASGYDVGRADALDCVRENGRVGLFGLPERPGLAPFPVAQLFRSLPTILVSRSAQAEPGLTAFHRAVELVGDGSFDTDGMVTHTFGIERIADAIELARQRSDGAIKVSVSFD